MKIPLNKQLESNNREIEKQELNIILNQPKKKY